MKVSNGYDKLYHIILLFCTIGSAHAWAKDTRMWVSKNNPFFLNLPSTRGPGVHLFGAISNRQAGMRYKIYPVIPKEERL